MQEQIRKEGDEEKQSTEFSDKLKQIKDTPLTRDVRLLYNSCCGCGCEDITILRTVPFDSPLKDGDTAHDYVQGDVVADDVF